MTFWGLKGSMDNILGYFSDPMGLNGINEVLRGPMEDLWRPLLDLRGLIGDLG